MADIQTLLSDLKELVSQINPLRKEAAKLREGLAKVERDYTPRLGKLNQEAEDLRRIVKALRAQIDLKEADEPEETETKPTEEEPMVEPPPDVPASESQGALMPAPLEPVKDERKERKLEVADHIESLLSPEDWSSVMEDVNAILADPARDVGDLLELVPWGDFWTLKAYWETTDEEQLVRLALWQQELDRRLAFWRDELRGLKGMDHYPLYLRMEKLSEPEWLHLLDQMALDQAQENDKLEGQISVLQRYIDEQDSTAEADRA